MRVAAPARPWRYVKANDLDGYRTLWDERFVGWPGFAEHPVGKASIGEWIPPLHADADRLYDYRVQKEAVRAFGDSWQIITGMSATYEH
jgi:hypothetical protein